MEYEEIFSNDLKSMLTGVFSKSVVIKNNTQQVSINAIVDDSQYIAKSDSGFGVADHNLRISLFESDVPFSVKTKASSNPVKAIVNSVEYIVTEWSSINDGRITLYLNKA